MRRRLVATGVAALLVAVAVDHFFVRPNTAPDALADAVIVLAGDAPHRLPVAVALARDGPGLLVISAPPGPNNAAAQAICEDDPGQLQVICFRPDPVNTRGEARAIGDLVAEHGWRSITVVTSTYHVTRARLLVERCTNADVAMADASPSLSAPKWMKRIATESGGLLKAVAHPSC